MGGIFMSMNNTPAGDRIHIGFFGRRNAGKSSVVNAVTGQDLAVVSDVNLLNDVGMQGGFVNILDYKDELPNFKEIFVANPSKYGTESIMKGNLAADGGLYFFPSYDVQRDVNHGILYRKDLFADSG